MPNIKVSKTNSYRSFEDYVTKVEKKSVGTAKSYLSYLNSSLSATPTPSGIRHWIPAYNCYARYLRYLSSNTTSSPSPVGGARISGSAIKAVFDQKQLKRIFSSRLRTQDRLYSNNNYCLPMRIIFKAFKGDKNFKKAMDDLVNRIKFLIGPSPKTYRTLSEIKKLYIMDNGDVFILTAPTSESEILEQVYTETFNSTHSSTGFFPRLVKHVKQISLDHDQPISTLVPARINAYPELHKLSDEVIGIRKKHGLNNLNQLLSDVNRQSALLKELEDMFNQTSLTIMQLSQNSKKNAQKSQSSLSQNSKKNAQKSQSSSQHP